MDNNNDNNNNDNFPTSSPTPNATLEVVTYLFLDALKEVMNGRKITRVAWGTTDSYVFMHNSWLSIIGGEIQDGKVHQFVIHETDMLADDWAVLPEGN